MAPHSRNTTPKRKSNWLRVGQVILLLIIVVQLSTTAVLQQRAPEKTEELLHHPDIEENRFIDPPDHPDIEENRFIDPPNHSGIEENRFVTIDRLIGGYVETTNHRFFNNVQDSSECQPPREPNVEWQFYNDKNNEQKKKTAKKRLLIGLYSGYGKYNRLLELTAKVNKAYARLWGHDVLQLQGTSIRLVYDGPCAPPGSRSTCNKITLLQAALAHKDKYDQLLILDTDALFYDFDVDVTTLLPPGHILAALKVDPNDGNHTHNVNIGVTLWDVHHPRTETLMGNWSLDTRREIAEGVNPIDDQYHLHQSILAGYLPFVHALKHEFRYRQGTVIKHVLRVPDHMDWNSTDVLADRVDYVKKITQEVCEEKYKPACDGIDVIFSPDAFIDA